MLEVGRWTLEVRRSHFLPLEVGRNMGSVVTRRSTGKTACEALAAINFPLSVRGSGSVASLAGGDERGNPRAAFPRP